MEADVTITGKHNAAIIIDFEKFNGNNDNNGYYPGDAISANPRMDYGDLAGWALEYNAAPLVEHVQRNPSLVGHTIVPTPSGAMCGLSLLIILLSQRSRRRNG